MPDFVAYYRVSTAGQGRSGLGLEAQRESVRAYVEQRGGTVIAEFQEVETGKGADALAKRPELRAALDHARKGKAVLVIAKLDRLARNVHFISGLIEQRGVTIAAADMPDADITMLQIYAVMAEHEARATSRRTKDALAAAKARGTLLGANGAKLAAKNKQEALERLQPLLPQLAALAQEKLPVRAMVCRLNEEGITTPAGGKWHVASLHRALGRLELR